ncbi:MAG: TonB-dependent receptor [Akkermansiaceae bacterium]|nr:TonB-dependent receptor [Akkermansiaceae bacterium]
MRSPSPRCEPWLGAVLAAACAMSSAEEPIELPAMQVLTGRVVDPAAPAAVEEWSRDEIRDEAPRTIDELLAREPSFSLYRNQTSIFGNPTSAGVSLRNTGATAASRTLVLLDGIPQNDPFGGWVYWARYQPALLDSVTIVPSSRSAMWGNQSPAGVVRMTRRPAFANGTFLSAGGGSQGTIQGALVHQATNEESTLSAAVSAFGLHSDGFHALDASQRGPVDDKLDIDLGGADVSLAWRPVSGLTVEPAFSYYQEERGNGTELSRNASEAFDLSLRLTSDGGAAPWQALVWQQRREFESVFSSVGPGRATETVALDQYDVPSTGTGGAFTMNWDAGDAWSFHAGTDLRAVDGATHEDAGGFRRRIAGGEQTIAGIFAGAAWRATELTRVDASARLDAWWLRDAKRVETALSDGSLLRDDRPPDRDGIDPSASIELTQALHETLDARVSAGTGFRVPTLNELYRPFRVRDDITEANPGLDPERFFNVEGGLVWEPCEQLRADAVVFHHWISDAIANVPVTDSAEISALFGTLPPGGSGSIRRNVDEARVLGAELGVDWEPDERFLISLRGIWTDTEFTDSSAQPLLEGKPFPQAPELRCIASGEWRATAALTCFAGVEYGASRYDDALASRSIPDFTSVRIGARWQHGPAVYQVRVENLLDEEIQTGLSSDGLRSYAAPRSLWAGVEWAF